MSRSIRGTLPLLLTLASPAVAQEPYVETIPGTLVEFEMVPVPGGTVRLETPAGPRTVEVAPFWIAKTETTWDLYDVYVYGLDQGTGGDVDAVTRPTRPYVLPGEEFGHRGMPALGMSMHAAREMAKWVSARTGKTYRVPTEAEWEHACRLGSTGNAADSARAWYRVNAEDRTHTAGTRAPDALGLHDMLGNVAEWVSGFDGDSVAKGGSFQDDAVHCGMRMRQTPAWNATDPQLPKSRWWLPDAVFLGVRLIRVRDEGILPHHALYGDEGDGTAIGGMTTSGDDDIRG